MKLTAQAIAVAITGVACGSSHATPAQTQTPLTAHQEAAPRPRPVDAEAVAGPGDETIAEGVGVVGFALDTGGDQMGMATETGLVVFARWRGGSLSQTVASCRDAGFGEPPPHDGRFAARCDGIGIDLELDGSTLRVQADGTRTTTILLPDGITFHVGE